MKRKKLRQKGRGKKKQRIGSSYGWTDKPRKCKLWHRRRIRNTEIRKEKTTEQIPNQMEYKHYKENTKVRLERI